MAKGKKTQTKKGSQPRTQTEQQPTQIPINDHLSNLIADLIWFLRGVRYSQPNAPIQEAHITALMQCKGLVDSMLRQTRSEEGEEGQATH